LSGRAVAQGLRRSPAAALRRTAGPRDPDPAGGPARRIRRSGGSVLPDGT